MLSSLKSLMGMRGGSSAIHPFTSDGLPSRRDADLEAASSGGSQSAAASYGQQGMPAGVMLARRRTTSAGGAQASTAWSSEASGFDAAAAIPSSSGASLHSGPSASALSAGSGGDASTRPAGAPTLRRVSMRAPEFEAASFQQAIAAHEAAELGATGNRLLQKLPSSSSSASAFASKRGSFNSSSAVPPVASDISQPDQASARSLSSQPESEAQGPPSSSGHKSTDNPSHLLLPTRNGVPAPPAPPPPTTQKATKPARPPPNAWPPTPGPPMRAMAPPPVPPSPAHGQQQPQLPPRPSAYNGGAGGVSARAGPMWGGPLIRMDSFTGSGSGLGVGRSAQSFTAASVGRPVQIRQPPRFEVVPYGELRFIQQIGEGGFGKVYYGHFRGSPCAIKVATVRPGSGMSDSLVTEFQREVTTMSSIPSCPYILRLIAACTEAPNLALVTEYCARGSLYSLLHNPSAGAMPLKQLLSVWLGVARGMAHLHACTPPVLHRDLKSANLLLDDMGGVRIADFGLSRMYADVQALTGGLGTYQWMAPEVLAHQKYSTRADVYSFGIVMWECLSRALPYQGMTAVQAAVGVVSQGLRPELPADTPPDLAGLIRACWAPVPDQRPPFGEVVRALEGMLGPDMVGAAVGAQRGQRAGGGGGPPDRRSAPGRAG